MKIIGKSLLSKKALYNQIAGMYKFPFSEIKHTLTGK